MKKLALAALLALPMAAQAADCPHLELAELQQMDTMKLIDLSHKFSTQSEYTDDSCSAEKARIRDILMERRETALKKSNSSAGSDHKHDHY